MGFLLHVLNEQSEFEELDTGSIRGSMDRWWANCMRNEEERQWIGNLIQKVRNPEEEYIFSRQDYEKVVSHRAETGRLELATANSTIEEEMQLESEGV